MTQEMDRICQNLNEEQDMNNNLIESIEVARQEQQLKVEEMEEYI